MSLISRKETEVCVRKVRSSNMNISWLCNEYKSRWILIEEALQSSFPTDFHNRKTLADVILLLQRCAWEKAGQHVTLSCYVPPLCFTAMCSSKEGRICAILWFYFRTDELWSLPHTFIYKRKGEFCESNVTPNAYNIFLGKSDKTRGDAVFSLCCSHVFLFKSHKASQHTRVKDK